MKGLSLACSFGFVLCTIMGRMLDRQGSVSEGFGWALAGAALLVPAVHWLSEWLMKRLNGCKAHRPRMRRGMFVGLCLSAVLLGWLPAFLGLYPGVFSYDVLAQVIQGSQAPYRQNHPLLHTLLLNGLLQLGDGNTGAAAYSLVQMALLAFAIAYTAGALYAAQRPLWITLVGVALAIVLPYHAVLAVSTTKDPLFAAAMLMLVTLLFEGRYGRAVLMAALMCLLRNNGWYALAAAAVLGMALCRKKAVRAAVALGVAVAVFFAADGLLCSVLEAQAWNTREALSVPIQQMARVIALHPQWQDDADVQALFQGEIHYDPHLSDPVKHVFRADGKTPISQVIRLWWRMFRQYPVEYADAFLELTQGWWDVLDESHSRIYGEEQGYMHTNVLPGAGVERAPISAALEKWYTWLVTENGYRTAVGIRLLFAPAVWTWVLIWVLLAALKQRRTEVLMPMLIPFGLLLTMLLGPCCLVRYAYPLMLCVPMGLGMLCRPENSLQKIAGKNAPPSYE